MLLNNTESISGALWITHLDEGTLTETPEKPEGFDEPHDAKSVGVSDMSMLDAIRHTSLEHDVIDHDDMMRLLKAAILMQEIDLSKPICVLYLKSRASLKCLVSPWRISLMKGCSG